MVKKEKAPAVVEKEEPPSPPKEAPEFSKEFLDVMRDYAYETLYKYLEGASVSKDALVLLDDLFIIQTIREKFQEEPLVDYIWNDEACNAVGNISQSVIKLGGFFVSPLGQRVIERNKS
jgi:hypothetical protein